MRMFCIIPAENAENYIAENNCTYKEKYSFNNNAGNSAASCAYTKNNSKNNNTDYIINNCSAYNSLTYISFNFSKLFQSCNRNADRSCCQNSSDKHCFKEFWSSKAVKSPEAESHNSTHYKRNKNTAAGN